MNTQEQKLYRPLSVAEKYAILEAMRLVYRPAHLAFKHRGGVANAVSIKSHF